MCIPSYTLPCKASLIFIVIQEIHLKSEVSFNSLHAEKFLVFYRRLIYFPKLSFLPIYMQGLTIADITAAKRLNVTLLQRHRSM